MKNRNTIFKSNEYHKGSNNTGFILLQKVISELNFDQNKIRCEINAGTESTSYNHLRILGVKGYELSALSKALSNLGIQNEEKSKGDFVHVLIIKDASLMCTKNSFDAGLLKQEYNKSLQALEDKDALEQLQYAIKYLKLNLHTQLLPCMDSKSSLQLSVVGDPNFITELNSLAKALKEFGIELTVTDDQQTMVIKNPDPNIVLHIDTADKIQAKYLETLGKSNEDVKPKRMGR